MVYAGEYDEPEFLECDFQAIECLVDRMGTRLCDKPLGSEGRDRGNEERCNPARERAQKRHRVSPLRDQGFTSLVTGRLLRGPPTPQPPMMPENMPASPPARTIINPPGRNLLTVPPACEGKRPPSTSATGISHKR